MATAAPKWEEKRECSLCGVHFSFFNRRHHCRNCGHSFCGAHSTKTTPIPKYGIVEPVRVCDNCFTRVRMGVTASPGPPVRMPLVKTVGGGETKASLAIGQSGNIVPIVSGPGLPPLAPTKATTTTTTDTTNSNTTSPITTPRDFNSPRVAFANRIKQRLHDEAEDIKFHPPTDFEMKFPNDKFVQQFIDLIAQTDGVPPSMIISASIKLPKWMQLIYAPDFDSLLIEFEIKPTYLIPQRFFPDREPIFQVIDPPLFHPAVVAEPWQENGYALGTFLMRGKNDFPPDVYIRDVVSQFVEALERPENVFNFDHELLAHPAYVHMLQSNPQLFIRKCREAADLKPLSEQAQNAAAAACAEAFAPFVQWVTEMRSKQEQEQKASHEQWLSTSGFQPSAEDQRFTEEELKIVVATKGNPSVTIKVSSDTTVRHVKQQVEARLAVALDVQSFQTEGRVYSDIYTMDEIGFNAGKGPFNARILLPAVLASARPSAKCRLTLPECAKRRHRDYALRVLKHVAAVLQRPEIGMSDVAVALVQEYAAPE